MTLPTVPTNSILRLNENTMVSTLDSILFAFLLLILPLPRDVSAVSIKTHPFLYEKASEANASFPIIEHFPPKGGARKLFDDNPDFLYNPPKGHYRIVEFYVSVARFLARELSTQTGISLHCSSIVSVS